MCRKFSVQSPLMPSGETQVGPNRLPIYSQGQFAQTLLPRLTLEKSCKGPQRLSPLVYVGLWLSAASNLREEIRIISGTWEANIHSTIRRMPSRKFFPTRIEGRGGETGPEVQSYKSLAFNVCFGCVSN